MRCIDCPELGPVTAPNGETVPKRAICCLDKARSFKSEIEAEPVKAQPAGAQNRAQRRAAARKNRHD